MSIATAPMPRRRVAFSQYSELAYIPKDTDGTPSGNASKWYTARERGHFREELVQDARRMAHELNQAPSPETLCQAVGIEAFVTPRLAKQLTKMKNSHIKAVLSEHRRQGQHGLCDPDTLSFVSERSSTPSAVRAHRLAVGYSRLE